VRYFFSTGEASGEFAAVVLAQTIRRIDPQAEFEGIGGRRMREAGFSIWRDHTGWASLGPLAAIPRIPKLTLAAFQTDLHVIRTKPDVVVLVDFGAFNIRLAKQLRALGYRGPIVDIFPPGAWLDSVKTAKAVSKVALALSAFSHQYEFYRSHDLPVAYFGHPLASRYAMRAPRAAPPAGAGTVAILPGSRRSELRHHVPLLLAAYEQLRTTRPQLRAVLSAADERAEQTLRKAAARLDARGIEIVRGTLPAIAQADAAWVAGGTALLECALSGVPAVSLYVVSPALARYVRRVYTGRFYTLPNLVLDREIVPELIQERATPHALAAAMENVLNDPQRQYADLELLREALGPPDAVERCAAFVVAAAGARIASC
jgi:lipid-A-disaccharide synthase